MEVKNKLILHRGYKGRFPENSVISFQNALAEGYSFETDVRLSKDRVPVMIHDAELDRLFEGQGKICDYTSEQLRNFRYKEDSTQNLTTLNELLALVNQNPNKASKIFLHIKDNADFPVVAEAMRKYQLISRCRIFSCDDLSAKLIEKFEKDFPNYRFGLHTPENIRYGIQNFRKADFVWADEITRPSVNRGRVQAAHRLCLPFYAISPELITESKFNADIEKRWRELLEMDVDGICTDMPEGFLKANRKYLTN